MSQYAVTVDTGLAAKHRRQLDQVRNTIANTQDPETLYETQSVIRAELREYQDRCERFLERLKQDCAAAMASLQEVMTAVSSTECDHAKALKEDLRTLKVASQSGDLVAMQRAIHAAVSNISTRVDAMVRENSLTLAAIKDEVRVLQERLRTAESAKAIDEASGALNRSEFEQRLRRAVVRSRRILVPISKIQNYKELSATHSRQMLDDVLRAVYKRSKGTMGESADVGRWSDDVFTGIIDGSEQHPVRLSRELAAKLSTEYSILDGEQLCRVRLRVATCVATSTADDDADSVVAKIQKSIAALRE